jgi:hypothetical protein
MDQSDEEEDFHSADEDAFDGESEQNNPSELGDQKQEEGPSSGEKDIRCNEKLISRKKVEGIGEKFLPADNSSPKESARISRTSPVTASQDESPGDESSGEPWSPHHERREGEENEDDEEALAERIRERNLKIARKFSAEIARSLKASAPIPVKTPNSSAREFPEIPDLTDGKSSAQPPAPPSTPALSSSFNNCSDPTIQTTAGTLPSLSTQFGWRIPPKNATQQSSSGSSTPSKNTKTDDQARHVLDRLSERLSQTDKNLFERVAADIKKVSIKDKEVPATVTTTDLPSALTSITDLGNTLSGWGWSGATKLLSSASQVTSQVGSVLDSVVGVAASEEASSAPKTLADKPKSSNNQPEQQAPTEIAYNDPLVDLTLNAMETISKRAFEVMTTRDETGTLHIKGLGRPWEHLLNANKSTDQSPQDERVQDSLLPDPDPLEANDSSPSSKYQSDSPPLPSTLKLRKRRNE